MKYLVPIIALFALLGALPAQAAASDAEIKQLREQLQALSVRLDQLEQANTELTAVNAKLAAASQETSSEVQRIANQTEQVESLVNEQTSAADWSEKIKMKGDFRYRMENIDQQGRNERNRQRIRARAAILADVTNKVEVGLGFASGGDDPVSTNQTIGGGGSTKDINLDLAYFDWQTSNNTHIIGGKFKNILYKPGKHALLWDGDWNPEGVGFKWASGDWFANGMGTWFDSDSKNTDTEFSYGLQGGLKKSLGDNAKLTAGLGYYVIDTAGKGTFFGDANDFFGNSFDPATNTYVYNYEELELFADLSFSIFNRPASLFLDYVQNQDADAFDSGYAVGVKLGSAKSTGSWDFSYIYQDLEADAVFGLVSDSDFGGGGTDSSGHMLKGSYAIGKNFNANFTYFINEIDANAGSEKDYDRLQLDLSFKY